MVTALGLAACSDDDGDGGQTTAARGESETTAAPDVESEASPTPAGDGEAIMINTRVTIPTGEVLVGSAIGDSPFCLGGTFRDRHGDDDIGLVDRTFRCPDGSLRIGFTPGVPDGLTRSGSRKAHETFTGVVFRPISGAEALVRGRVADTARWWAERTHTSPVRPADPKPDRRHRRLAGSGRCLREGEQGLG